jgi:hypothetical protein
MEIQLLKIQIACDEKLTTKGENDMVTRDSSEEV